MAPTTRSQSNPISDEAGNHPGGPPGSSQTTSPVQSADPRVIQLEEEVRELQGMVRSVIDILRERLPPAPAATLPLASNVPPLQEQTLETTPVPRPLHLERPDPRTRRETTIFSERQWTPDPRPGTGDSARRVTTGPLAYQDRHAPHLMSPSPPVLPPSEARPIRIKTEKPDRFTGKEPSKLRQFLTRMDMMFKVDVASFGPVNLNREINKVYVAISFLDETAFDWAQDQLERVPTPHFLSDWELFKTALVDCFGEPDEAEKAAQELQALRQVGRFTSVMAYTVEFNRLAYRAKWSGQAAIHMYRSGLSERIKDALALFDGDLSDLRSLQHFAFRQDVRLTERETQLRSQRNTVRNLDARKTSLLSKTRAPEHRTPPPVHAADKARVGNGGSSNANGRPDERRAKNGDKPSLACFSCGGPHLRRNCPLGGHSGQLNALEEGVEEVEREEDQDGNSESESSEDNEDLDALPEKE